ncbi:MULTISPECIES: hypothetical protein [unclassified Carboxylicivirga]|uniref:hypothetical protein n=1 Tax=Carboxylicivirga TaxID=1628153 RepID=UPI003D3516F9
MKQKRYGVKVWLVAALFVGMGSVLLAQSKKVRRMKVIHTSSEAISDQDSACQHDIYVIKCGGETQNIDVDSILEATDIEREMEAMIHKMDSLPDIHFQFEGTMEDLHAEIERQLKEKGIEWEQEKADHHQQVIAFKDGDVEIEIEEALDAANNQVRIMRKKLHNGEANEAMEAFIIRGDDVERNHHRVEVTAIPLDDLHILKDLGVSSRQLLGKPLVVKDLKVKIEKALKNEVLTVLMQLEGELPDGKCRLQLFNDAGETVKEVKELPAGGINQGFELKKEEAPYYLVLTKYNQLFGRKIEL